MKKITALIFVTFLFFCVLPIEGQQKKKGAKEPTLLGGIKKAMDAEGYTPVALFRTGETRETWIYLSHIYNTNKYRIYIGPMSNMARVQITDVDMLRDGGSIYFETKRGTIFVPVLQSEDQLGPPTWGKGQLIRMNLKKFKIAENGKIAIAEDK